MLRVGFLTVDPCVIAATGGLQVRILKKKLKIGSPFFGKQVTNRIRVSACHSLLQFGWKNSPRTIAVASG